MSLLEEPMRMMNCDWGTHPLPGLQIDRSRGENSRLTSVLFPGFSKLVFWKPLSITGIPDLSGNWR